MQNLTIFVPNDHPHFAGHFPGSPILPGVSQINYVLHYLRERDDKPYRVRSIRRAKFRAIIKPDTEIILAIQDLKPQVVRWTLKDSEQIYSSGELEFAE